MAQPRRCLHCLDPDLLPTRTIERKVPLRELIFLKKRLRIKQQANRPHPPDAYFHGSDVPAGAQESELPCIQNDTEEYKRRMP